MTPNDLRAEAGRLERERVLEALARLPSERAVALETGVPRSRVREYRLEAGLPALGRPGRPMGGGGVPELGAIREAVELVDRAASPAEREAAIALLLARAREV